jgi:glutathione synthase/RimK-type ligase-like ATP-grasp enzyme
MKILLLGTRTTAPNPDAYYAPYLDFFKSASVRSSSKPEIAYALTDDLFIAIGDGEFTVRDMRNDVDLSEYGAVIIRGDTFAYVDCMRSVSAYLRHHGVPSINDYSTYRSPSKLAQALQFYEHGLPVAQTVLVTPAVVAHLDKLSFGFPCIMKATHSSYGNSNYKLEKPEDVARILAEDAGKHTFVLQRFTPNDCDYRVLVAGDEVLVIKRTAIGGSHLNNTSKGAEATLAGLSALPAEVIRMSQDIAKKLNMTLAGVDVLYDQSTGSYSFLEVNSQPQLVTGAFIDEKGHVMSNFFDSIATPAA